MKAELEIASLFLNSIRCSLCSKLQSGNQGRLHTFHETPPVKSFHPPYLVVSPTSFNPSRFLSMLISSVDCRRCLLGEYMKTIAGVCMADVVFVLQDPWPWIVPNSACGSSVLSA